jgi:hypothetical protein
VVVLTPNSHAASLTAADFEHLPYSGAAGAFRAFDLAEFQLWVCEGFHQEYTRPPYSRISVKTPMLRVKVAQ